MHPQIQDADSLTMSALRSKADIRASLRQVCFVPQADTRVWAAEAAAPDIECNPGYDRIGRTPEIMDN